MRARRLFCSIGYTLVQMLMKQRGPMTDSVVRLRSLSERTAAAATELLAGRRQGLRGYGAFVGPAVVASIAYMDPGNFATNIQAGARNYILHLEV